MKKFLLLFVATLCLTAGLLPAHATPTARVVTIKTAQGAAVAEITVDGTTLKISEGARTLTGVTASAEKHRYTASNGGLTVEVKASDADGFKVRDASGKLLWKIKIAPAKIKISDNEEGTNAFEITSRETGIKVEQAAKKLGGATFAADKHIIKVVGPDAQPAFEATSDAASLAPAVLLLPKAAPEHKYIIIAELLSRRL